MTHGTEIPTLTDIEDSKKAMDDIQSFTYSGSDTFVDAKGIARDTVTGRIKKMGFTVPIPYVGGVVFAANDNVKTVEESNIVYAPLSSFLPFTTSGTFIGDDDARFFVVQGLTADGADVRYVRTYDTLEDWKSDPFAIDEVVAETAERNTGKGGGGKGDVISGIGGVNGTNIVQHNTLPLSWVLRINKKVYTSQLCDFSDGVGDDQDGLQSGFSLVAMGVKLVVDARHRHTANLSCVTSGFVDIEFIGDGEIITDSSITDQTALWISHLPYVVDTNVYYDPANRPGGVALTVNAVKGEPEITLADGSIFSKGDYVYIISTNDYITIPLLLLKKGENRKLSEVAGNILTLDGGIDDDYFFAGTTVFKYNPPIVSIKNLNMTGADDGDQTKGLFMYECISLDIDHPTVTGYNMRGMEIAFCSGGVINNPNNDFADAAGGASNYSLVLASSRDLAVNNGAVRGGRHSFSTGGYIPCRNVIVDGLVCYWSDSGGNGRSSFDVHLQMIGFKAINCIVYGAMDIAGENLEASGNVIFLKNGGDLRGLVARVYKNTEYVKLNNNIVHSLNSSGGVVIRHMRDNVLINKAEQDDNVIFMSTPNARPALGLEPNSVSGSLIRQWSRIGNHIDVRDSSDSAVGMGNYDINKPTSLVSIEHTICKDNYVLCLNGTPIRDECADKNTGDFSGNHFIAESDVNASFTMTNYSQLNWDKNHCSMSLTALAAEKSNLFDTLDVLNINAGSITNSFKNGYRLLNVTEHNPVNLARINCVIDAADVSRLNAQFVVHSSISADAAGSAGESYQCTVAKTGTGQYTITFGTTRPAATGYPMFATSQGVGFAQCNYNNVNTCFVTTRDPAGTATDMAFSFISF